MRIVAAAVIGLTILGIVIFGVFSEPSELKKARHLRVGMSKDEVEHILGPASGRTDSQTWIYGRPYNWSYLIIYFDTNQTYKGYHFDR